MLSAESAAELCTSAARRMQDQQAEQRADALAERLRALGLDPADAG